VVEELVGQRKQLGFLQEAPVLEHCGRLRVHEGCEGVFQSRIYHWSKVKILAASYFVSVRLTTFGCGNESVLISGHNLGCIDSSRLTYVLRWRRGLASVSGSLFRSWVVFLQDVARADNHEGSWRQFAVEG